MMEAKLLYLHALTPVHVGTGQAVANVDLPIAREKATGFPIIPASAFKGVLRDYFASTDWVQKAFGMEVQSVEQESEAGAEHLEPNRMQTAEQEPEAGDWAFTDLRILCLPVRSFYGTFAYTTCPLVLNRLLRVARGLGLDPPFEQHNIPTIGITGVALTEESVLHRNGTVYLEDLDLTREDDASAIANALAGAIFSGPDEKKLFTERLAVVSDQVFSFLSETATEVVARVRLQDEIKTVARGALWYEETVPAESLFYGFITHVKPRKQWVDFEHLKVDAPVQIGGDATIGRGICRVVIR